MHQLNCNDIADINSKKETGVLITQNFIMLYLPKIKLILGGLKESMLL
jgi:hypothetical protein